MLFDKIVFGPIHSRRLGSSLGINLLPTESKICSFDCIYCECGFNFVNPQSKLPTFKEVASELDITLKKMSEQKETLDVITFAGNGEPTLHPDFKEIIDKTIELRNRYFPNVKISVLSNSTMIFNPKIFNALLKVDNNILKLDTAIDETAQIINQPTGKNFSLSNVISELQKFKGKLIIQTLFFSGEFKGKTFNNTTKEELDAWLSALQKIRPKQVMIYSLDRDTPAQKLKKTDKETLLQIAQQVEALGISTLVTE